MAKALVLEFATATGTKTQMTIDDDIVKQDLKPQDVRAAMEQMITSGAFSTNKDEVYSTALGASYVERTETVLFDDTAPAA